MDEIFFTELEKELYFKLSHREQIHPADYKDINVRRALLSLREKGVVHLKDVTSDLYTDICLTDFGEAYIHNYPKLDTPRNDLQEANLKLQNENLRYQKRLRWSIALNVVSVLAAVAFGVLPYLEH